MHATLRGDIEALTFLHQVGANPHATNDEGATALALAASHGNVEAARFFIEHRSSGVNELIAITVRGDREEARKAAAVLLQAGADGVRALLNLATPWQPPVPALRRLIEAGADRDTDSQGRTALMRAVEMTAGFPRVRLQGLRALRVLLDAGADTGIMDGGGKTARMQVAELAHSKGDDAALLAFQQARA